MVQSEAVEREKVPWTLIIASCLFISAVATIYNLLAFSGLGFYNSLNSINAITAVTAAEWLILFLALPLARLGPLKRKIDTKTLTYLYIAGISAAFYTILLGDLFAMIAGQRVQRLSEEESWKFYDWFLAPSRGVVQEMVVGKVIFPASEWFPVLAFWWIFTLMPSLFLVGIVTLFRRSWIDIEKVPFPLTMVSYELLKRIPYGEGPARPKGLRSSFLIGLIVGIAFQTAVSLTQLFPWFPDIFAIRGNCCGFVWYVRADSALGSVVGLATANLQPLMVAVSYFMPLSILFNSWFWYFVYVVMMQVAWIMGYYTDINTINGCGRGWCISGLVRPPFNLMSVSQAGGLVGLTIFSVWLSRKYLIETISTAFGGAKGNHEIERNEAMSYRSTWLLVIGGFVGTVIVFMVAGVSLWPAFLMPVTYFLYFYANSRLYGLSGGYMRGMEHANAVHRLLVWPTNPPEYTREFMLVAPFTRSELDICSGRLFGASYGAFASFRMANLTNLDNRNAFKAILAAAIIIPVTSWFFFVWIAGYIGVPNVVRAFVNWGSGYRWAIDWDSWPNKGDWVPYFLAGILIVGVLSLLHSRFIWFPFEPVGFLNGMSYNSLISGLWLPFLIAWILKTLTLKIGGSKAYEEYGLPLASGTVAGCMLVYIILGIVGMIRFYYPF